MNRPTIDEYYLKIALDVSTRSPCLKKHYGAVIVKDNFIVSTGYNGPAINEPHCKTCTKVCSAKDESAYSSCPAIHAEQNAIIRADADKMSHATLYLAGYLADTGVENMNVAPCEICLRLIKNAGIDKIITNAGVIYSRNSMGILQKL